MINGRFQTLQIVGVALSPEFIYSIRPGDLLPDDRRYAIVWMSESEMSAAFDMKGRLMMFACHPCQQHRCLRDRADRSVDRALCGLGALVGQIRHRTALFRMN